MLPGQVNPPDLGSTSQPSQVPIGGFTQQYQPSFNLQYPVNAPPYDPPAISNSQQLEAQLANVDPQLNAQIQQQDVNLLGGAIHPAQFHQTSTVLQFNQTLEVVVTHEIPKIEALARSALDGINRAYEQHIDPSQTAANLQALREALVSLYLILRQSGLGALPLHSSPDAQPFIAVAGPDPRLAAMSQQVDDTFKQLDATRKRANVVVEMLRAGLKDNLKP
ncbi:hypothetical protein FRC03_007369 [Tulasnella sp. 419]|nr:hypothetical protein FRC02_010998 [Tulasnella sp. 418]KAG8968427.1 hypothetical protein FRC03_007369 [Tulasnella sp. 419]